MSGGFEEGLGHLGSVGKGVDEDVDFAKVLLDGLGHLEGRRVGGWVGGLRR